MLNKRERRPEMKRKARERRGRKTGDVAVVTHVLCGELVLSYNCSAWFPPTLLQTEEKKRVGS